MKCNWHLKFVFSSVSENEYLFFDGWYYKVIHYLSENRLWCELIPAEFPDEYVMIPKKVLADSKSLEL